MDYVERDQPMLSGVSCIGFMAPNRAGGMRVFVSDWRFLVTESSLSTLFGTRGMRVFVSDWRFLEPLPEVRNHLFNPLKHFNGSGRLGSIHVFVSEVARQSVRR